MQKPRTDNATRHEAQSCPEAAAPIGAMLSEKVDHKNAKTASPGSQSDSMIVGSLREDAELKENTVTETRPARDGAGRGKLFTGGAGDTHFTQVGRGMGAQPRSTTPVVGMAPKFTRNVLRDPRLDDAGRVQGSIDTENIGQDFRTKIGAEKGAKQGNSEEFVTDPPGQPERGRGRGRAQHTKDGIEQTKRRPTKHEDKDPRAKERFKQGPGGDAEARQPRGEGHEDQNARRRSRQPPRRVEMGPKHRATGAAPEFLVLVDRKASSRVRPTSSIETRVRDAVATAAALGANADVVVDLEDVVEGPARERATPANHFGSPAAARPRQQTLVRSLSKLDGPTVPHSERPKARHSGTTTVDASGRRRREESRLGAGKRKSEVVAEGPGVGDPKLVVKVLDVVGPNAKLSAGGARRAQRSNALVKEAVASEMPAARLFSGMGLRICLRRPASFQTAKSPQR